MTKDFDPKSSRFNRYVTLPAAAIAIALGASACKSGEVSADSKPATTMDCYWDVKDGDSLSSIAVSTTEQASTPADIRRVTEQIFEANVGQGAELQSPSGIQAENDVLLPDAQCKIYDERVEEGSLDKSQLDRVEKR